MSKKGVAAFSAGVRDLEQRITSSVHEWNRVPELLALTKSADCRVIFFALPAASRVLAHLLRATSRTNNNNNNINSNSVNANSAIDALATARLAVAAQCGAHRAHLIALIARSDDKLFGNADESQRRGVRVAAVQALMQLVRDQGLVAAAQVTARRPRHCLDSISVRDLIAALCSVPSAARQTTRVKLSLNELAREAGVRLDGEDIADEVDSDDDEAAALRQRAATRRGDEEALALIAEFCREFGAVFDDVRFVAMRSLARFCESVRRAAAAGLCSRKATARFCRLAHALLTGLASVAPADDDDDASGADGAAAAKALAPDAGLRFLVPVARGAGRDGKAQRTDDDDDSLSVENVGDALHDDDIDDATFARLLEDSDSDDVGAAANVDDAQTDKKRKRRSGGRGGGSNAVDGAAGVLRIEARREHRKEFGNCWLAFLRLPLPLHVFKASLARLADRILPHMEQPLLLCDLLTNAFSRGGAVALLALAGLFELIVRHNLDYPHFFEQLYSLLEPQIFLVKYRARFFELTAQFLASPMLPAATAAAFVRRVLQLAATGPVYAGLLAVPFAYNVMRRHPACVPMIHREQRTLVVTRQAAANSSSLFAVAATKQSALLLNEAAAATDAVEDGKAKWVDPFDADEPLPDLSRAIDSSIFELEALRRSYYEVTAHLVRLFEQPIGIVDHPLRSVLTTDYNELMHNELQRKLRTAAAPALKSDLSALTAKDKLFVDAALSDELWISTLTGDETDDEDDDDDEAEADAAPPVRLAAASHFANPDDEDYS